MSRRGTRFRPPKMGRASSRPITMPSLMGLGLSKFARRQGSTKFDVFVFVRHAFGKTEFVNAMSPWRSWSWETSLVPLDRGRFVCAPAFDFLCSKLGGANSELKIRKLRNFGRFFGYKWRQNQPMRVKLGSLEEYGGPLQCTKFNPDRSRGWYSLPPKFN